MPARTGLAIAVIIAAIFFSWTIGQGSGVVSVREQSAPVALYGEVVLAAGAHASRRG